jgi:hypothetical protein
MSDFPTTSKTLKNLTLTQLESAANTLAYGMKGYVESMFPQDPHKDAIFKLMNHLIAHSDLMAWLSLKAAAKAWLLAAQASKNSKPGLC